VIAKLILIPVLAVLMQSVRDLLPAAAPGTTTGTTVAFGFLMLEAFLVGQVFARLRLPRLTGYLVCGILVGPSALGLVSGAMVDALSPIKGVAVCLIALTAGGELNLRRLRPLLGPIASATGWTLALTGLLATIAILAMRPWLPFLSALGPLEAVFASAVLGVVMASMSPAVVMALLNETEATGPYSRTILGVVVATDIVVVVLFALISSLAKAYLGAGAYTGGAVLAVGVEVFASLAAGAGVGALLAIYLRRVVSGRALFVLLLCVLISEVGGRLGLDPLITCLAAGLFIENVTELEASALVHDIEAASLPVFVVFFSVAGASLRLDVLGEVWLPAVLLVGIRAFGMWAGSHQAFQRPELDPHIQRWGFVGFLPQAGLSLGLAMLLPRVLPGIGDAAAALVIGVVGINELIMPPLLRWVLARSQAPSPVTSPETASAPAGPR
jgi:Kef-type K+ transport system membrane component KefB